MIFKVGDKLKPKKGSEGECGVFKNEGGEYIIIADILDGDELRYEIYDEAGRKLDNCCYCFKESDLEYFDKTEDSWPDLKAGDILELESMNKSKRVISVMGEIVFCQAMFDGAVFGGVETLLKGDLIVWGYKRAIPKAEDPIIEVTPEEIAEWKGVDVSKIKVVNNF